MVQIIDQIERAIEVDRIIERAAEDGRVEIDEVERAHFAEVLKSHHRDPSVKVLIHQPADGECQVDFVGPDGESSYFVDVSGWF